MQALALVMVAAMLIDFWPRSGQFTQHAHTIDVGQLTFELTRVLSLFLSAFAFFNVGRGAVPLDNLASLISQRHGPHQEPTIFALRRTKAQLTLEGIARTLRGAPHLKISLQVFWMDGTMPARPTRLLGGQA